jgi:WD40 repeat protein
MRRAYSQRSRFQLPYDGLPEDGTPRATARLPILGWGLKAGLGALASVLALGVVTSRDGDDSDHSLLGQHPNWVQSVAFDHEGRWVASAGDDQGEYIWDLKRRGLAMVLGRAGESQGAPANCVAFMRGGATLAVAKDDGNVTFWDVALGRERHSFRASSGGVRCLAFSPDGLVLATGSTDHSVALWDVATSSRRAVLLGSSRQVNCVVFSPDGRTLASASTDGTARLWDVSSGESIRTLNATAIHFRSINCVAYSADGRVLATACPESGIALWDAASGRRLEARAHCEPGAMTVAFSPNGETLAAGATDGMIELWDAGGDRRLSVWRAHAGAVASLAYSSDGRTLASGGNDADVRIWEVSLKE